MASPVGVLTERFQRALGRAYGDEHADADPVIRPSQFADFQANAALALANALDTPAVWGRILFVGGGPSCQVTYREYLARLLAAMGVEPLPDEAFSTKVYATDWLDTEESEALLHYQRHTFDEIAEAVAVGMGWRRRVASAASPLARAAMLRLSPYYKSSR